MPDQLRILHVVGPMSTRGGGAETWLMDVYRRIDRTRFAFDFLIHTPERLPFHTEIEALGGRLLRACRPLYLWKYGRVFRRLVAESGPFDACHVHIPYCGYALRLARTVGIPVRIAHSHNDRGLFSAGVSWPVRAFLVWTNRWVNREATAGLACSRLAAGAMYGADWERDARHKILCYGIDTSRFSGPLDGRNLRAELGIPPDAFVIGHVGRFQEQKNHAFLIDVAAELIRREPNGWLLLVGDGPLRAAVERRARRRGIRSRVTFAGLRGDVPDLMRGAMDVFALPSLFEGFGLVGVEAQAAGLPLVVSDTVPAEIAVVPGLTRTLSLSAPANVWADALLAARSGKLDPADLPPYLDDDRMSIDRAVRRLEAIYSSLCRKVSKS